MTITMKDVKRLTKEKKKKCEELIKDVHKTQEEIVLLEQCIEANNRLTALRKELKAVKK